MTHRSRQLSRSLFAMLVASSLTLSVVGVVAAHHADVTANMDCDGLVTYTVTAWNGETEDQRTNTDISVLVKVDGGDYVAQPSIALNAGNDFTFTGTFSAPGASSVKIKVQAQVPWGDGTEAGSSRSVTVTAPTDCTPPAELGINVKKTADPTSLDNGGGSVTYTYAVTNTGNVPLSDVTITDDKCESITGPGGDKNDDSKLDVQEIWTYECTMNITETTVNTVVVEGWSGEDKVTDDDQATVNVGQELPATGTPKATLPSTSTEDASTPPGGSSLPLLLILLAAGATGIVVLSPLKVRRQR